MPVYKAPLKETRFLLHEVFNYERDVACPAMARRRPTSSMPCSLSVTSSAFSDEKQMPSSS